MAASAAIPVDVMPKEREVQVQWVLQGVVSIKLSHCPSLVAAWLLNRLFIACGGHVLHIFAT
eukprot:921174-Amphidinium_carterae.1